MFCFLRMRLPPRSTRTVTLFPDTTLVRAAAERVVEPCMESLSVTRGSRPLYRIRNRKSQRIHRDDDPRSPAGLVAQRCVDLLHQRLDQPLSEGPALGIAVGPDADTVVGDRKSTRLNSSH